MNTTSSTNSSAGRADAWLALLLSPDCTPQDRAEFNQWLDESPQHVIAYVEAERLHQIAGQLANDEMLRAAARAALREAGRDATPAWRRFAWWAPTTLVAGVLVAVTIGMRWWVPTGPAPSEHYATQVGERRELTLQDGSRLMLDTDSSLSVRFDNERREVEVERGRVQFVVAQDAARPFTVRAGEGSIRDIGTTFQVHKADQHVEVGLIEGKVIVTGAEKATSTLAPGQQVSYDNHGRLGATEPLDVSVANAWPGGDLVFKNQRLDALLVEMNRYSTTKLRLAEPELGRITVSGVFHAGDQAALLEVLKQGWSLRAERRGDEIYLRRGPV